MYPWGITEQTAGDIERLEELRHALDREDPLPRRWQGRLRRELEAESIAASTSMEGVPVTVEEVRRILAALVHVRLAGIHPFVDGNGRTARVLSSLAMYRKSYSRQEFTSLEEWWGSHLDDYCEAFTCLGKRWDPSADVTPFVEAHVRAQRLQVDALSLRRGTEQQLWTVLEDIATEDVGGKPRLADALYDAFFGREVTNRYYRGLADVSVATATNDLTRLETGGLLRTTGEGRSRAYAGTKRLIKVVARAAGLEDRIPDSAAPIEEHRSVVIAGLNCRARCV